MDNTSATSPTQAAAAASGGKRRNKVLTADGLLIDIQRLLRDMVGEIDARRTRQPDRSGHDG